VIAHLAGDEAFELAMLRELVDKQRKVAVSMGFPEDGSNEELFLFMKEMREFLAEVF
jgi:hypothetical protein